MAEPGEPLDAIVVGAGFSGLYMLHQLRQRGYRVLVLEQGGDVGGTWYWNRYPGARCDIASLEYSYSFDQALQQEWTWSEIMAAQPEILSYAREVADRHQLRPWIRFNTRVVSADFDESRNCWLIRTSDDVTFTVSFCIMATGCLSVPNWPDIPGKDQFANRVLHTGSWPREPVDFSGLRVGMIGTGSSGVQATPVIAEQAEHLYIFQRTPVYTLPAHNRPIPPELDRRVKANYAELREAERHSLAGIAGFGMAGRVVNPERALKDTSEAERIRALDKEGFDAITRWTDVLSDTQASELASDMYQQQVRRQVKDPTTAEGLTGHDYPIGCKRQVYDCGYYDAFNQGKVTLIDLRKEPLQTITPAGLRTQAQQYQFDLLIFATGFDAMTGALNRIDISGRGGQKLAHKWRAGPRAYLGLQSHGFPNLFLITGPGSPSVLSNMMVSIEQHVEFVRDCLEHLKARQLQTIEPVRQAEDDWIEEVNRVAAGTMFTSPACASWYLGANIPGKQRVFMPYVGGVGRYRALCEEIVADGYRGFRMG